MYCACGISKWKDKFRNVNIGRLIVISAADVSFYLKKLLKEYHFNVETLTKYPSLSTESVYQIARGNVQVLPDGFMERAKTSDKMMFLAMIPEGLPDLKVKAFLEIVLSYHQLSKETIAKMAGIKTTDVDLLLSSQCERTNAEIKYKIAAVTMALRFFLRDNEPEQ